MSIPVSSLLVALTLALISPLSVRSRESQFFSKVNTNHNSDDQQWPEFSYGDQISERQASQFQNRPEINDNDRFSGYESARFQQRPDMENADQASRFDSRQFEQRSDSDMKNDEQLMARSHPEEFRRQSDFKNTEQFPRFQPTTEFAKPSETEKKSNEEFSRFTSTQMKNDDQISRYHNQAGQFEQGFDENNDEAVSRSQTMEFGKESDEMMKKKKAERYPYSSSTNGYQDEGSRDWSWKSEEGVGKKKGQEGMSDTRYLDNGRYFYDMEKEEGDRSRYGEGSSHSSVQGSRGGYYYRSGQKTEEGDTMVVHP